MAGKTITAGCQGRAGLSPQVMRTLCLPVHLGSEMKEDILEQLAADYLELDGYFTVANVKFRPDPDAPDYDPKQDSVHSDIDVLGYNPLRMPPERVVAISCKSLQEGFWPAWELEAIKENRVISGREAWRRFRELARPKWGAAFRKAVQDRTGDASFTYVTAVTKLNADRAPWEQAQFFHENLQAVIKVITLEEMVAAVLPRLTTTVANSELARTLQLLRAAGVLGESKA